MNWKEIKSTQRINRRYGDLAVAQQIFFRVVWWLYKLMPEKEARDFMYQVVDPEPIVDWETGAEIGDPCPRHPDRILSGFTPPSDNRIYLECSKCNCRKRKVAA